LPAQRVSDLAQQHDLLGRCRGLFVALLGFGHPGLERVVGLHDKEEHRSRHGQERKDRIEEQAVRDDGIVPQRDRQRAEVRLAEQRTHDRGDHIGDQAVDDRLERQGDDEADGYLDDVAAGDELLELLEHQRVSSVVARIMAVHPWSKPLPLATGDW